MSDFYLGSFIEETRKDLYEKIEEFNTNCCCLGRFAGLVIAPINALTIVANVLAVVIDTILQIWHAFEQGCGDGFCNLALVPLIAAIQIPLALIEGTLGLIYDLAVPLIAPINWAKARVAYHNEIDNRPVDMWITAVEESPGLLSLC